MLVLKRLWGETYNHEGRLQPALCALKGSVERGDAGAFHGRSHRGYPADQLRLFEASAHLRLVGDAGLPTDLGRQVYDAVKLAEFNPWMGPEFWEWGPVLPLYPEPLLLPRDAGFVVVWLAQEWGTIELAFSGASVTITRNSTRVSKGGRRQWRGKRGSFTSDPKRSKADAALSIVRV